MREMRGDAELSCATWPGCSARRAECPR